ncbi:hypothetical protein BDN72DRAFT_850241 [Pluteus cervinus]|uniref:Uncharacterized protein n=1 Tax=Pluteus cervinus TaxID=181527 RepID=A0ACD3A507_9AGAR|nr:hypothetical protein BDN72DRAFT_850241 [Pluteus cervinus]
MAEQPEPIFPPEIEEIIFSLCAQSDLPNSKHLIFVAKRVYAWLRPQLYKIAIFNSTRPKGLPRFDPNLLEVHGRHLRHILLWVWTYSHELATYLSWCPNVVDLALWGHNIIYDRTLINQLRDLPLTHLSFDVSVFHGASMTEFPSTTISFPTVTHLEPIGLDITLTAQGIKNYFPSVTHILGDETQGLSARDILDCWEDQLEVLIWYREELTDPDLGPNNGHDLPNDPRLVLIHEDQYREYVNEWNERAKDGPESIWRRAEGIIESRLDAGRGSNRAVRRVSAE